MVNIPSMEMNFQKGNQMQQTDGKDSLFGGSSMIQMKSTYSAPGQTLIWAGSLD